MSVDVAPIRSVGELLDWPLREARPLRSTYTRGPHDRRTKVMLVHDMKGGYLPFETVEGCAVADCFPYMFLNYQSVLSRPRALYPCQIDIFNYFAHHFVSLPPRSWTALAHKHFVKVLGSLVVESTELLHELLSTDLDVVAARLVDVASALGIQGYLVNIEVKMTAHQVRQIEHLVDKLRDKLSAESDDNMVVWYDAVTTCGKLNWQNELNEQNDTFLQLAHNFYLNYGWTNDNLERTCANVTNCGHDNSSIFLGIDVFGGFNTALGVQTAQKYGFSAAIFAPGWIVEHFPATSLDRAISRELKFWRDVEKYSDSRNVLLPFHTDFGIGLFSDDENEVHYSLERVSMQINWGLTHSATPIATGKARGLCISGFNEILRFVLPAFTLVDIAVSAAGCDVSARVDGRKFVLHFKDSDAALHTFTAALQHEDDEDVECILETEATSEVVITELRVVQRS